MTDKQDMTPDMTGFQIRDGLQANGGGEILHWNFDFDDPGEVPVVIVAASGDVAKALRQVMGTFSGESEYDLRLVRRKAKQPRRTR